MAAKRGNELKHLLEFAPVWIILSLTDLLPYNTRIRVGSALIGGLVGLIPGMRRRVDANLELIFPSMSSAEKKRIKRASMRNMGRGWFEMMNLGGFPHSNLLDADPGPGFETLKQALAEGKGAILASGHFGQVSAYANFLHKHGLNLAVIYRENTNPYYEACFLRRATRCGDTLVPAGKGGLSKLARHMAKAGIASVLTDQAAPGVLIDFLGKPAHTSTKTAELALKLGVPLIPVYGTRLPDGKSAHVEFEAPIPHTDAETMTAALNDSLSARVTKHPDQYYWLHRRWKNLDA